MSKVHREFGLEGNIGQLEAFLQGVESKMIVLRCPENVCTPTNFHFPVKPGQALNEALSEQSLPSCVHGALILPDDLVS